MRIVCESYVNCMNIVCELYVNRVLIMCELYVDYGEFFVYISEFSSFFFMWLSFSLNCFMKLIGLIDKNWL